jgi:hypothetical protein
LISCRDDIGAGIGECGDEGIDRRDHQMYVERQCAVRFERLDHVRANGDVGDEMSVHHVDMDVVGAGVGNRSNLLAQARKVGGKYRGSDARRLLHGAYLPACQGARKNRPAVTRQK